jgi:hypothetical protein
VVVWLILAVAGCGSEPDTSPVRIKHWTASELGTSFVQYRIDEGTMHVTLQVTNKTDRVIDIASLALHWSGLVPQPVSRQGDYPLPAGATVAFPIDLKGLRCSGGTERPAAYVAASGRTGTLPLDRTGESLLRDFRRRGCNDAAVRAAADISFGASWRSAGAAPSAGLRGSLVLHRRSNGEAVTITSMSGSVLLDLAAVSKRRPIAVLGADQQILSVPVVVRSNGRCDQHALGQSSQTFLLHVGVRVGTTSTLLIVKASRSGQQQIATNVKISCKQQNQRNAAH